MSGLVLSLFPGLGLLDAAFEEVGFTVVRGPDLFWGGDVRRFHVPAGRFDGLIGGPPCQRFSRLRHMVKANGYELAPDLIPEFRRCVAEAAPTWWLMENVPDAPVPEVAGYHAHAQLLVDVAVGGLTSRCRRFTFGTRDGRRLDVAQLALHREPELAILAQGGNRRVPVAVGGSGKRKSTLPRSGRTRLRDLLRAQGLPPDFLNGCPLTAEGKRVAIGNGVPRAMGLAVARGVIATMTGGLDNAPRAV